MDAVSGIRTGDLLTLIVYFIVTIGIGVWCARRMSSTEGFFVGGRAMPGWAVGISIVGTAISSVTFLAYPGSAFAGDWSRLVPGLTIPLAAIAAVMVFVPFYRRARLVSVNEYLESRFGPWARVYACVVWSIIQFYRMGLILFLVALAVNAMTGYEIGFLITVLGVLIVIYTVMGGIEAVIWTDVIQTLVLLFGGLICIAMVAFGYPDGLGGLISDASSNNKFDLTVDSSFDFTQLTLWVLLLYGLNQNMQEFASDQTKVQRYCAASNDRSAIWATLVGGIGCVPVWMLFMFVGTSLWGFYTIHPDSLPAGMIDDQVFPHFILTELPIGVAGFVMAAVLAAAMSSIDSSLNGTSAVLSSDLYQRFIARDRDDSHYLNYARGLTIVCGTVMIACSIGLHIIIDAEVIKMETVLDLSFFFYALLACGVGGLFALGFFTTRANSQGALAGVALSIIVTVGLSASILMSQPDGDGQILHRLMIGVVSNVIAFIVGYGASMAFSAPARERLANLTVFTWNRDA